MQKLYKLTDEKDQTRNNTQWGKGVTHKASGEGKLCGPGWLHAYTDPLLAVLLNSIHADFKAPHLWEAEGEVGLTDDGLKVGCTVLTTVRRMELPVVTTEQRVRFGILCAMEVCGDEAWRKWAQGWLSGEDRGKWAAEAAWAAAEARAAAEAAREAAWAAEAARAAAWVAAEAWAAAWVAAEAARAAARAAKLNLIQLAKQAVACGGSV